MECSSFGGTGGGLEAEHEFLQVVSEEYGLTWNSVPEIGGRLSNWKMEKMASNFDLEKA
jgi:hypothetical protein